MCLTIKLLLAKFDTKREVETGSLPLSLHDKVQNIYVVSVLGRITSPSIYCPYVRDSCRQGRVNINTKTNIRMLVSSLALVLLQGPGSSQNHIQLQLNTKKFYISPYSQKRPSRNHHLNVTEYIYKVSQHTTPPPPWMLKTNRWGEQTSRSADTDLFLQQIHVFRH